MNTLLCHRLESRSERLSYTHIATDVNAHGADVPAGGDVSDAVGIRTPAGDIAHVLPPLGRADATGLKVEWISI